MNPHFGLGAHAIWVAIARIGSNLRAHTSGKAGLDAPPSRLQVRVSSSRLAGGFLASFPFWLAVLFFKSSVERISRVRLS